MELSHKIIIGLLVILIIIVLYQNNYEYIDSPYPPLPEATPNIASGYNNQNLQVKNLKATGDITGNLIGNVTGNVTGNLTGNINGNTAINGDINMTGNVRCNNKGMRLFWMVLGGGSGVTAIVKDPSGNTFNKNEWVLFNVGVQFQGLIHCHLYVGDNSLWYIARAGYDGNWILTNILAFPREMFEGVYPLEKLGTPNTTANGTKALPVGAGF